MRQPGRPGEENVVDLLSRLTSQGAHLAQEQLSLMQAEVREAANDVKQATGAFAGAAVVGIAGLGVVLMGLGYLLGDAIDNVGLGILIVGVISLIVAAILAAGARKKLAAANLKPTRTIRTVEDTPDAVTGHFNSAGGTHGNNI
jgi:hypothetical protein